MATTHSVFTADIDIGLKNAKQTLDQLKRLQNELKGLGKFSVDLSQNFKNMKTTLDQFNRRNTDLFGKGFSNYIKKTSNELEILETTIDSLFKNLPRKTEPAVVLLRKRFNELTAEAAKSSNTLAELDKYNVYIGKLESAKPKNEGEAAANKAAIEQLVAKRAQLLEQIKNEGHTVESLNQLYKQQLKAIQEVGVQVKVVSENQSEAAAKQREYTQAVKEAVSEQAKLVREAEKQAAINQKVAVEAERFQQLQLKRDSQKQQLGGVVGLVASYKDMFKQMTEINPESTGLKRFGDISREILNIWSEGYAGSFGRSVKDIYYGLDTINTKGTNAFNAIKIAVYGASAPTDKFGKFLVSAAEKLEDFKYATYGVNKQSAEYVAQTAQSLVTVRKQSDAVREQAQALLGAGKEFTALNTRITSSINLFERIQGLMQKGITDPSRTSIANIAYVKSVDTLNTEFEELENVLVQVYKLSNKPENMHPLIAQLRQMKTITTETKQAMNQASDAMLVMGKGSTVEKWVGALRNKVIDLIDPFKAIKSESELLGKNVHKLTGSFDEPIQKTSLLSKGISGAAQAASTFKDAMTGAVVGSFLGPMFGQAIANVQKLFNILLTPIRLPFEAIIAPFKLLGTVVDTVAAQVHNFFAALPSEFLRINQQVQNFNITLDRLMTGYSKDVIKRAKEGVNQFIEEINAKTPFTLETSQAAFQQLTIAGLNARKWLEPVSDAASTLNKDMSQLIFALQRIKAGASGMGVQMVREFGIPVKEVGVWVDAMGKAVKAQDLFKDGIALTDEQLKQNGLTFKQWKFDAQGALEGLPNENLDILNGYLQQNVKFAGASAARANSLQGIMSNLNVAVAVLIDSFGQPIFQKFTDILNDIYGVVLVLQNAIKPFAKVIGEELANSLQRVWELLTGIETSGVDEFGNRAEKTTNIIKQIADTIMNVLKPALYVILAIVKGDWPKAWGLLLKYAQDALKSIATWLKGSGREWVQWGIGLVKNIATGIITGAKTLLKAAITSITTMISNFLKPGSPPKEGPLSDMDKWGPGLIKTLTEGFKLEDLDFLTAITDPIKSAFEDMGLDTYKNIRSEVMGIISGINETGTINEQLWSDVQAKLGAGNKELKEFIYLNFELKKATKEYQDAEKAGFIPKEVKDRLDNAKLQVQLKEEELKLQDQINAKQNASSGAGSGSGTGTGEKSTKQQLEDELELLKKRRNIGLITEREYLEGVQSLRKQYAEKFLQEGKEGDAKTQVGLAKKVDEQLMQQEYKFLEKKKKLGLITETEYLEQVKSLNQQQAEAALAAGDEAQAKALVEKNKKIQKELEKAQLAEKKKELEKEIEQERQILKIKYEKGLITEQEYKEGLLKIQEGYVDKLIEMGFPVDKEIAKLKELKAEVAKATELPTEKVGDDIASYAETVTDELSKMMDSIKSDFSTLGTATWDEFSKTFNDSFSGIWNDLKVAVFGEGDSGAGPTGFRETVMNWFSQLWTDLTSKDGPLANMTQFFNRISEGFTTWANGEGKKQLGDAGQIVGKTLVDGIYAAFGWASGEGGTTTAGFIYSLFKSILAVPDAVTGLIVDFLKGAFDGVFGPGIEAWKFMLSRIFDPEIGMQVIGALLGRISTGIINLFKVMADNVADILGNWSDWVVTKFNELYETLVGHSIVPDMVAAIVASFGNILPGIQDLNITGGITDIFTGLYDSMVEAGGNWIEGLKEGLTGGKESLEAKVTEVAQSVRDYWPFSPAKKGPLSEEVSWTNYLVPGLEVAITAINPLLGTITSLVVNTATTVKNVWSAMASDVSTTTNAMVQSVNRASDTISQNVMATAHAASQSLQSINDAISHSRLSEPLGGGFGNYGHNQEAPNFEGGIAATWRRFFASIRGGTSGLTHLAVGSPMVMRSGPAFLHRGEMVLTSRMADAVRTNLATQPVATSRVNAGKNEQYNFSAGAFANAFPNVTKGKDAKDIMDRIQGMVMRSGVKAQVVS